MSNPFCINVGASIFRLVKNGDNAASPSTPNNVVFDAFGQPYQGIFLGGQVTPSGFSVTSNALGANQTSNKTYSQTISFGTTFAQAPQLLWLCEDPATGGWTNQYCNGAINTSVSPPTGSFLGAFGYTTPTGIVLGYTIVDYSSPFTCTPPTAFSYRVFQI